MTMKLARHTPGPWTRMFDADGDNAIYSGDVLIAVTSGTPEMPLAEDEANADLLAAAPDMLEALQLVRMSAGWRYLSAESKLVIDHAIRAAVTER